MVLAEKSQVQVAAGGYTRYVLWFLCKHAAPRSYHTLACRNCGKFRCIKVQILKTDNDATHRRVTSHLQHELLVKQRSDKKLRCGKKETEESCDNNAIRLLAYTRLHQVFM